jgi:hypothetical protein
MNVSKNRTGEQWQKTGAYTLEEGEANEKKNECEQKPETGP